jgi:hypothetical protein
LLTVVGLLAGGFVLGIGSVAFVWFTMKPVEKDTNSWRDVDETVADWTRPIPHVGAPLHVALYNGFRGNVAKVDLDVASARDVVQILRALGVGEAPIAACSSLHVDSGRLCKLYTGFDSRIDGKHYGWNAEIEIVVAGPRFVVNVIADQDYH